ncbi:MAG TPA: ComF family protein [Dongiaceae bacterium]|nr:ComF family protein [Dongiaceae bacterium]
MLLQARTVLRTALDAVLPPRCLKCGDILGGENGLCMPCWGKLAWLSAPCCACCGQPFAFESGADSLCGACLQKRPAYDRARAVFRYDAESRDLILGFKHADRTELAPTLARWMARSGAGLVADCALIVPVPLHWTRLAMRRFNQAGLLAQAIGKLADRPVEPRALTRRRATRSQGHLGRLARRRNVQGAMAVAERLAARVADRRILLVDDVITTGATAETAAKALISAGATAVDVLALAKVVRAD